MILLPVPFDAISGLLLLLHSCLSLLLPYTTAHTTLTKTHLIIIAHVLINKIRRSRGTLYGTLDINCTQLAFSLHLRQENNATTHKGTFEIYAPFVDNVYIYC